MFSCSYVRVYFDVHMNTFRCLAPHKKCKKSLIFNNLFYKVLILTLWSTECYKPIIFLFIVVLFYYCLLFLGLFFVKLYKQLPFLHEHLKLFHFSILEGSKKSNLDSSFLRKLVSVCVLLGHYMYIEASGRTLGQKARLISPKYTDSSAMCLQFFYHMYGDGIGILNVYAKVGFMNSAAIMCAAAKS